MLAISLGSLTARSRSTTPAHATSSQRSPSSSPSRLCPLTVTLASSNPSLPVAPASVAATASISSPATISREKQSGTCSCDWAA
jgi:hypothetical protein